MVDWQAIGFQVVNGLVWSFVVALIALGLNSIYGLLGVLNMAHGAVYAWGAVLAWFCMKWLGNFWLALLVAPVAIAVVSVPIYQLILKRTIGKEMMIGLLATSGLLFLLTDGALSIFGGSPKSIQPPLSGTLEIFGLHYPIYRFAAAGIAAGVLICFWGFLRFTRHGIWIRCVAQSPTLAMASGVPVERVYWLVVCLSCYFAALAGVLAAPMTLVHYQMGMAILGPAFIVIVVGGLGNLLGAVVAAIIIGVGRGVLTVFMAPTYADLLSIAALLPLLALRPNGIFGDRA